MRKVFCFFYFVAVLLTCNRITPPPPVILLGPNGFNAHDMTNSAVVNINYKDTIHLKLPDFNSYHLILLDSLPSSSFTDSIFSWTPTISDTGTHSIRILLLQASGIKDTLTWSILVRGFWPSNCPISTHKNDAKMGAQEALPQGYFVYSASPSEMGLYASPINSFLPKLIPNTNEDHIRNMSISNDGNWICYVDLSRNRVCLITKYGCKKAVVPLNNCDLGYPMIAGFRRGLEPISEIYYLSDHWTLRCLKVDFSSSSPIFSNDRIIAKLSSPYTFNANGNVHISVVKDQIFGGTERTINSSINYSSNYITIPNQGLGIASNSTIYKWKDDSTFQPYGCGHTQTFDGAYCLANAGPTIGEPQCTPQHHNGFYVTPFRKNTDTAISFQYEQVGKLSTSVNWCPLEYQAISSDKVDFWGWYLTNSNNYVVGRQDGSLNQNGIWLIEWRTNTWTRLSPQDLNISTPQPALYFYKQSDDTLNPSHFCSAADTTSLPPDSSDLFNPHYQVIYPNGGEDLKIGSTINIRLHATISANAYLYISIDAGKNLFSLPGLSTIINPYSDSLIQFTIPDSLVSNSTNLSFSSNKCTIILKDYSNKNYYDASDSAFTIGY